MVAKIRSGNPLLKSDIIALEKAYKREKRKLWKVVIDYLKRSKSRRVVVNIGKIAKLTNPNDVVIVPGKVLGGGVLGHRVIVGGFAFSQAARSKIIAAGGDALPIRRFLEVYSNSKGVKLIGG